jgi:hypothetical protein
MIRGTKLANGVLVACALGVAFGALTSITNGIASPSDRGDLVTFVRVTSLILAAGWAWAALAVVAGWLAGTPARGAVSGVVALTAATTAYYGMDSIVRQEPLAWYGPEMLRWWLASVVCGPALGAIGAYARRPGLVGLLAGLAIPVGAAVQMIVLPPAGGSPIETAPESWARLVVVGAASAAAAVVVARFVLVESRRRPT